ncbi:MAG: KamA family radical SAM protein [Oligoflexales bacterium]|nr:KamA family radical SAM protein [Oligoflexales bacterium]
MEAQTKQRVTEDLGVFEELACDQNSLSHRLAIQYGVEPETFINWRWQMKHQLRTSEDFQRYCKLDPSELGSFAALKDLFNAGVTPYYAGLINEFPDQQGIRLQAIPRVEEMDDLKGLNDPLEEVAHSPVREVVHVYPDRVAFCVAMLCPVYCRYCYRKRRDDEEGLHFNRSIVDRGIAYIASNPAIKDVLITGGDPFIASDQAIDRLLARISEIPHVEIIRFGTRTPVTLPYRVTANLAKILKKYHPVWVNTHFNCTEELTPEACAAVSNLVDHGIPVGNQSVLLRGVNDSAEKMQDLCRALIRNRVRPYYVFHAHMVAGTAHLRVPISEGIAIMKSLRGNISGYGIPSYILDTPSGKVPIGHNHILGQDGHDLIVEDLRGEIWRETDAMKPMS